MQRENPLAKYFRRNKKRQIHKWMHYFDIYDTYLSRFRGRKPVVVEFGVQYGGSLQMWRHYFGRRAKIYGIDIDPRCQRSKARRTKIFIGDQGDRGFLESIAEKIGPIDIVIDDGGHHPHQQIATFEVLYPLVKETGIFIVEDTHTSYSPPYKGGLRKQGTFMEYAKNLTDQLTAWHSKEKEFVVDEFTRSTKAMHFYGSVVVFEKGKVEQPQAKKTGIGEF